MFDDYTPSYPDKQRQNQIKKLRQAWEVYYAPMKMSKSKLIAKVRMRVKKGIFPAI